ncbi:MAG: hypothetical protein J6B25_07280 [Clostridia bacterium]|nr:hypothetical protein [Clostridia bacterium]
MVYGEFHQHTQNTASKSDTDELAYTIATTLENRRNGNTDPSDAFSYIKGKLFCSLQYNFQPVEKVSFE